MWVEENISLAAVVIDQRPTTKKQMKSSSHFLAIAIVLVSLVQLFETYRPKVDARFAF